MNINITNIIRKIIDVSYYFHIIFLWFYSIQNTEWFQNSKHRSFETINMIIKMKDTTCTSFCFLFVWFLFSVLVGVFFWLDISALTSVFELLPESPAKDAFIKF